MTIYPQLDQKTFDYLPEPFKEVIRHDSVKPKIPEVIQFSELKGLKKRIDEWKERKYSLIAGCENVIAEMKKGS